MALLLAVAYLPAIHGPLLFDDAALPFGQRQLRDAPLHVWLSGPRPLLMITYWLNYQFSGTETFGYHLLNLLLHAANGVLVFFLLRSFLPGRRWLCAFGSVLFLLHPLQTESVAYLAGRSELVAAGFLLAAILVFRRRDNSWRWAAQVSAFLGAAILSKEHALAVIPLLLLLESGWLEEAAELRATMVRNVKAHWRLWTLVLAAGCAGAAFVVRILSQSRSAGFGLASRPPMPYFFTECRVIFKYLRLFVFPAGQNMDPHPALSHTLFEHGAAVYLAILGVLVWMCFRFRRRAPLATFGFLTFLILLAPTSSIVPLLDPMAEHRMYLPLIGLTLIGLDGLSRLPMAGWRPALAMSCVVLLCAGLTFHRSRVWSSAAALAEDAAAVPPLSTRAFHMLARAYLSENRAQAFLERVGNTWPQGEYDRGLFVDWGLILASVGRDADAVEKIHRSLAIGVDPFAFALKGFLEARLGRAEASLADLNRAIQLAPEFDVAYCYRGLWYLSANQLGSAIEDFRRALSMNPMDTIAQQGLAEAARRQRAQPLTVRRANQPD